MDVHLYTSIWLHLTHWYNDIKHLFIYLFYYYLILMQFKLKKGLLTKPFIYYYPQWIIIRLRGHQTASKFRHTFVNHCSINSKYHNFLILRAAQAFKQLLSVAQKFLQRQTSGFWCARKARWWLHLFLVLQTQVHKCWQSRRNSCSSEIPLWNRAHCWQREGTNI